MIHEIILQNILGDASLAELTNGSTAPSSNNIGSLVNLSGHQLMISQTITNTVSTAGNTSYPLIGNILLLNIGLYFTFGIYFLNFTF